MAEVVTFGEAMLRLTAPGHQRLEAVSWLEAVPGGAELNVAVAAARLGLSSAWVSALPDNPLGRLVAGEAARHGVDVSGVAWLPGTRLGLYFVERGAYPRPAVVTYDRADSAVTHLDSRHLDWPRLLEGARVFHTSGITPALGEACHARTREAIAAAGDQGVTVSFDTNYRSKLWSGVSARACLDGLLPEVDWLFTSPSDLEAIFGWQDGPEDLARRAQDRFGLSMVAISLRGASTMAGRLGRRSLLLADRFYWGEGVEHEVVDPLGSGDAFTMGVLYGALRGNLELGVKLGDTLSAMKQTLPGDLCLFSLEEAMEVMERPTGKVSR